MTWRSITSDRRAHRLAGGLVVVAAGVGLVAWKLGVDATMLQVVWQRVEGFLKDRPCWLFAGLVVLPGLPVPTSALLFLAGTVWGDRPVVACALCLVAMALNMTWTYWVAARPGRRVVEKWLAATALRVPDLPQGNPLRMILVLRLTPGLPLFVQNYVLGFFRVPFRLYLPVSMGCTGVIASGIVLSGAGVAKGSVTPAVTGVALVALGWLAVQMIRKRLERKRLGSPRWL
ncbi:MAG: hypothetical protein RLZZ282_1486 [Verrucomicrobiota bacterium]